MIDSPQFNARTEVFWQAYLASLARAEDAASRSYGVMRIGGSDASADHGAALIKQGVKTTTSSLLWTYEAAGRPLPDVGSFSIVVDGHGDPVCLVESVAVDIRALADVDAAFADAYGEWDRTLKSWRAHWWEINAARCRALGKGPTSEMPLVCERLAVVFP